MGKDNLTVIHSFPIWLPQTQTWMYNQARYLPGNIDVHIACERTENIDQFGLPNIHSLRDVSEVKYIWQKAMRNLHIRYFQDHLSSVIRDIEAPLVHSHFGDIAWNNLLSVRKTGAKHIVTFYGYDVSKLLTEDVRWLHRYEELFELADLFLCEGPFMARQLVKLGCKEKKVRIQHLGVDLGNIRFQPRFWEPGTPLRILIAASFREKKGIPIALKALARIQTVVPLEITIIGDAISSEDSQMEKRRILDVINAGGLSPKTKLLGFRTYSELFAEAYKNHVFISPSIRASDGDTEGGAPISLIDMMATGMLVISTVHCDIPEVVHYGIRDWLVDEHDVDGLVERLVWIIEHPDSWLGLAEIGRKYLDVEFSASNQGERLSEIYQKTVGYSC